MTNMGYPFLMQGQAFYPIYEVYYTYIAVIFDIFLLRFQIGHMLLAHSLQQHTFI